MNTLFTVQEVSEKTGLSRGVVWRAIREGKLKLSKETRPVLVSQSDLTDWTKTLEPPISKSELEKLYISERKPMSQIAKLIGVGTMTVHRLIKSFGVPVRPKSESMKGRNTWGCDSERIARRKENMHKPHNSDNRFGENHWRWMGGDSGYRGESWPRQRRKARQRDNFTCQRCGVTEEELGQELDVHHISKYREFENHVDANDLSNLISYCKTCHGVAERELERSLKSD